MNDLWTWATLGGAVSVGTFARELAGIVMRLLGRQVRARQTDAEIAAALRDELRADLASLRERVVNLEDRADALHKQLMECEERSTSLYRENEQLREHAEALAERVGQLDGRRLP